MKSRYCYNPMTPKRIGRRVTLFDRIRRSMKKRPPELFPVTGYDAPVIPGKR